MKHIWSVLCKKSIIDSETNNISLNEVLEELSFLIDNEEMINKPINFPFDFEIVTYLTTSKKSDKADMEVELVDPSSKLVGKFEQKIEFPDEKLRLRVRVKMSGIGIDKNGEYLFKVKLKGPKDNKFGVVAEIPLLIKKELAMKLK